MSENVDASLTETGANAWDVAGIAGVDAVSEKNNGVNIEPEPDVSVRFERVLKARNPLLEAARPLLRALSDMPKNLPGNGETLEEFRKLLDKEVRTFQSLCDKANLRREHVLTARYCLCTAIDEAANSMQWGMGGVWAISSLAQRFHQDTEGGKKFFLLLGRLTPAPEEHIDLLEVMYRILALGFQGMYSAPENYRQLESIRYQLLSILNAAREPVEPTLSPHWKGESQGKLKAFRNIPVWVSASIFGLILFAVFSWHKYHLLGDTLALEADILAIAKLAPPASEPLRLAVLLKDEIAAGRVMVQDSVGRSSVVFRGDDAFMSARAEVSPKIKKTLDRVAAELNKVPGKVIITGHSDSQPMRGGGPNSNQVLSEKRAASVAQYLVAQGVNKERIQVVGKGDAEPLAENTTPVGRARNRRVEILVIQ